MNDFKTLNYSFSDKGVPIMASEDFSEFGQEVKSCFFFYAIGTKSGLCLHSMNYDFNDDCLENISKVWLDIITQRLLHK